MLSVMCTRLTGVSIERCKRNNIQANLQLRNDIKVDPFCGEYSTSLIMV